MVKVLVRLHTVLKEESGVPFLEIEVEELTELVDKMPNNVREVLNKYKDYLIILVNGVPKDVKSGYKLKPGDVVDITIPVGGG